MAQYSNIPQYPLNLLLDIFEVSDEEELLKKYKKAGIDKIPEDTTRTIDSLLSPDRVMYYSVMYRYKHGMTLKQTAELTSRKSGASAKASIDKALSLMRSCPDLFYKGYSQYNDELKEKVSNVSMENAYLYKEINKIKNICKKDTDENTYINKIKEEIEKILEFKKLDSKEKSNYCLHNL